MTTEPGTGSMNSSASQEPRPAAHFARVERRPPEWCGPSTRQDRRASIVPLPPVNDAQTWVTISGPLTRATRGQPRSLGTARNARSAPLAAVTAALPKLIVRVRFSSPAPRVQAQLRAGMPSPRLEHPHTFFDLAGHERATSPRGRARPPGRRHRPRRRTARLGRGSRWRS